MSEKQADIGEEENENESTPFDAAQSGSTGVGKTHHHHASKQAHMITSVNRDALAAPNVDIIAEEEEEEEDEEEKKEEPKNGDDEKTDENNDDTALVEVSNEQTTNETTTTAKAQQKTPLIDNDQSTQSNNNTTDNNTDRALHFSTPEPHVIASKFTLETVNLDTLNDLNLSKIDSNPNAAPPVSVENDRNSKKSSSNDEDNSEVVEIKVEEGYATRQMDEYFRQTIAAIKEELTKKLETEKETSTVGADGAAGAGGGKRAHHNQHYVDIDEYDTDAEFDDDEYDEDEDEELGGADGHTMTTKHTKGEVESSLTNNVNNLNDARLSSMIGGTSSTVLGSKTNRRVVYQNLINFSHHKSAKSAQARADKSTSWLVLIGCCLNQFIIEGLCYNYGNLFTLVQKNFNFSSRLVAMLPGALLIALFLLFAPISVFLSKQYGTRRVAVVGTFISMFSLLVCRFINNFIAFLFFYGIFTGVGISLIYVPSMLAISRWFIHKRLFANSLTVLSAGFGAAIYPVLSEFILRKYNLFDCLLILSGIQLNCLIGSLLLKEHPSPFVLSHRARSTYGRAAHDSSTKTTRLCNKTGNKAASNHHKKSSSADLLLENDKNELKNQDTTTTTTMINNHRPRTHANVANKRPYNINNNRRQLLSEASETESTTSVSTATVTNYTLKQYWRKFIQTRKSGSNNKKNLFHLIAEEKRKTRTLSKTSLEDGFVITTSNNLLAPNDDSHVIVSRQAKLHSIVHNNSHLNNQSNATRTAASKFFTRIANSLRSLTHTNTNQANVANPADNGSISAHSKLTLPTSPACIHEVNENAPSKSASSPKTKASIVVQNADNSPPPASVMPLMSVFDGPLTDLPVTTVSEHNADQTAQNTSNMEGQGQGGPTDQLQVNNATLTNDASPNNQSDENYDTDSEDDDDDEEESATSKVNRNISSINNALKNQRYLTYRNSIANSVRGSLIECSVPEDREDTDNDQHSGCDVNSSLNEDDDVLNESLNNTHGKKYTNIRSRKIHGGYTNRMRVNHGTTPLNSAVHHMHNNTANNIESNLNGDKSIGRGGGALPSTNIYDETVGYALPTLVNLRRFISTMEVASFYNVPLNLESIEYNLKNSLMKLFSDNYRRQHKNMRKSIYRKNYNFILFLDYLSYLTSFRLFINPILFLLNVSFFLNMIGYLVILFYIGEFSMHRGLDRLQSVYIIGLIGFMCGLGRIVSTISYKVNPSNSKSRIFAYILTVIVNGACVLSSTVLCDSFFSFSMFAICFGLLIGVNLNLRTIFIYDMMAIEWSDDSLFCYTLLTQSVAAAVGVPLAGLIHDLFQNDLYVFYYAGSCLLISALILTPGRKIRTYCYSSYKSLNKFYLQRRYQY